jgi:probable HAF family extracellular repeat protein
LHPFRYGGGTMTDLGTFGGQGAWGMGINSSGVVVGDCNYSSGYYRGYRCSVGSAMEALGTLGGTKSSASAINDDGKIAGFAYLAGDTVSHAVRYDATTTAVDLGTLGGSQSAANDIDRYGQVVGNSKMSGDTTSHAFLHDGATMIDLNDRLLAGTGWTLTNANGINDLGWIVGRGVHSGNQRAFLLTPCAPEPGTWAMLVGLALCGLAAKAKRRQKG